MIEGSFGMDCVHARELVIEGVECQQPPGHTHIVPIAGEGWTDNQHDGGSEEGIASKAKIWLKTHSCGELQTLAAKAN